MLDNHRVVRVLCRSIGVSQTIADIVGILLNSIGGSAKGVATGMGSPQRLEHSFEAIRKAIIGRVHTGKLCVSTDLGHLAGIQYRTGRRNLVVGVICVPTAPDIGFLRVPFCN